MQDLISKWLNLAIAFVVSLDASSKAVKLRVLRWSGRRLPFVVVRRVWFAEELRNWGRGMIIALRPTAKGSLAVVASIQAT